MTILDLRPDDIFNPADDGITFDYGAIVNPTRVFVPTNADPVLDATQKETLVALANWQRLFPAQGDTMGRTLYASTKPDSGWPIKGIKMKGAGGLKRQPGGLLCYPPTPNIDYGVATEFHLALDAQLKVSTVAGRPKANNSLRSDSAVNEFECQQRLYEHRLGFRGLLAGRFLKPDGSCERDLHDQETGAVFLESDPDFRPMDEFLTFFLLEDDQGMRLMLSRGESEGIPKEEAVRIMNVFIQFSGKMAEIKSRAAIVAGIGRHAGHLGNFLFNQYTKNILLSDTDSAVQYERLNEELWGPQLLRDMANDMTRMIQTLSLFAFSRTFFQMLEDQDIKPFESFLRGYLGDSIPETILQQEASALQKQYMQFVLFDLRRLSRLSSMIRNGRASGIVANWGAAHLPFTAICLDSCYTLMQQSTLSHQGFVLPAMDRECVREQFMVGIVNHCGVINAESDAVRAGQRQRRLADDEESCG